MILIGVFRASRDPVNCIYSEDPNLSRPIFRATMPRDRFKLILRFLRFDDFRTRLERQKSDQLAHIRFVFDSVVTALRNSYNPNKQLTIDEHLCKYRGHCPFRQYIPSKPDKYGIKMFIIADALNYFPINIEVYTGVLKGCTTEDTVIRLASHLKPGHRLFGDNFFSSVKLCNKLRNDFGISYLGTLRKIRREIPEYLLKIKGISPYTSTFLFNNDITLVSYIARKNRSVLLLSNMHHDKAITDTVKLKPAIIMDYNKYKSGVDVLDHLLKEYRPYKATRRWPCAVFFDLLSISSHASYVIYKHKFPESEIVRKRERRTFLYQLGVELITPQLISRKNSSEYKYLHKDIKSGIDYVILKSRKTSSQVPSIPPTEIAEPTSSLDLNQPAISGNIQETDTLANLTPIITSSDKFSPLVKHKRSRCDFCPRPLDKKSRSVCSMCNKSVCNDHYRQLIICHNCQDHVSIN